MDGTGNVCVQDNYAKPKCFVEQTTIPFFISNGSSTGAIIQADSGFMESTIS